MSVFPGSRDSSLLCVEAGHREVSLWEIKKHELIFFFTPNTQMLIFGESFLQNLLFFPSHIAPWQSPSSYREDHQSMLMGSSLLLQERCFWKWGLRVFIRNAAQLLSLFPSKTVMPKRGVAVSVMSLNTKQSSPCSQQISIQQRQAKGARAATEQMSQHRTAAYPALLSNSSQLTLTKGPFSRAVSACGGAKSKAARASALVSATYHLLGTHKLSSQAT